MTDYLINLIIAVSGSSFGAVAGVYLTYRYLRRHPDDAIQDDLAINSDDNFRKIFVSIKSDENYVQGTKKVAFFSGAEFVIISVSDIDERTVKAVLARVPSGESTPRFSHYDYRIRLSSISFMHDI